MRKLNCVLEQPNLIILSTEFVNTISDLTKKTIPAAPTNTPPAAPTTPP